MSTESKSETPNDQLKPCPFCGCVKTERDGVSGTEHREDCYLILMESELPNSPLRILAWNNRPYEKELNEVNEKLEQKDNEKDEEWLSAIAHGWNFQFISGMPDVRRITTSHVEKQNHTLRMHCRRLTRLTNAFSKKFENFQAAVALKEIQSR